MKKRNRVLALMLMIVMTLGMSLSSYAAGPTDQTYSSDGSHTTKVSASITSTYAVKLPTAASLAPTAAGSSDFTGSYTVQVKGYLKNSEYVSVVPGSLVLTNTDDTTVKETATITQAKTYFRNAVKTSATDVAINKDSFASTTGTIAVTLPVAGAYEGDLVFTFKLNTDVK